MEYKESRINTRPKGLQHLPLGLKSLPSSQEGKTSNILKMELIASDPHLGGDGAQVGTLLCAAGWIQVGTLTPHHQPSTYVT